MSSTSNKSKNSSEGKPKSSNSKESTGKTETSRPRHSKSGSAKPSGRSRTRSRSRSRSPVSKSRGNRPSICKQFMSSECNRGNCPFYHPPQKSEDKKPWFVVCMDFKNGRCPRHDCRYFHITPEDEERFVRTGEISSQIIDQAMQKVVPVGRDSFDKAPICKDFIKGICKTKCRYYHVNIQEYEEDVLKALRIELSLHVGMKLGKDRLRDSPTPFEMPPMCLPGNFDMATGGNIGFDGDVRLGDPPFNNFQRGELILPLGPFVQGPNSLQMTNLSPAPFSRDFRPFEAEGIRREYEQLREDFLRLKREKEEEVLDLRRKLGSRDFNSGGFDQFGNSNDGLLYRQLQLDLQKIYDQNEELLKEVKENRSRERNKEEAKRKSLQKENLETHQKLKDKEAIISSLKSEIKMLEKFKSFVEDQSTKIRNQLALAEYEMTQSWGGGTPPMSYMKQSWSSLKTLIMKLNPSSTTDVVTTTASSNASVSSPVGASYGTQSSGYKIETLKSGGTNSTYSSVNNTYSPGNNAYSTGNRSYSTGNSSYNTGNNSYNAVSSSYGAGNSSYSADNSSYSAGSSSYGTGSSSYSAVSSSYSGGNNSYSSGWSSQTKPPSSSNYN